MIYERCRTLPPFDAVIFDMDGVVLDSEPTYHAAWQRAATELGFNFSDHYCRSFSGLHQADVEAQLMARLGDQTTLSRFGELSALFWLDHVEQFGIGVKSGFYPLQQWLLSQRIPFCLATNSTLDNTLTCLRLADIGDLFEIIVTRDQVVYGKPEPDIYLAAANAINHPPERCLAIEDSAVGLRSAYSAGTIPLLVTELPTEPEVAALAFRVERSLDAVSELLVQR